MSVALALIAMLVELAIGYPAPLLQAIGHPVTWMGRLIAALDRGLNREGTSRLPGVGAVVILLLVVGAVAVVVARGLGAVPLGILPTAIIASSLLAQRSLHRHVAAVAQALDQDGLDAGRAAVAHIVGRDTEALDRSRRRPRGDRKPGREFLRRRRRAGRLDGHRRSPWRRTL